MRSRQGSNTPDHSIEKGKNVKVTVGLASALKHYLHNAATVQLTQTLCLLTQGVPISAGE